MHKICQAFLTGTFIALTAIGVSTYVHAQPQLEDPDAWERHQSVTGTFEAKFLRDYSYKIFPFQFNKDKVAMSGEVFAYLHKGHPEKEKTLIIKTDHTFGAEISKKKMEQILERTAREYEQAAINLKGRMTANEDIEHKGFKGKRIYVSYMDGNVKRGLRVRVYITNYAKVEQIVTGIGEAMYSYRVNDFFDSLKLQDGIIEKENPLGVGWVEYPSPNNIFTAVLPPKNSNYTPQLPHFTSGKSFEKMSFAVFDPVVNERVFYKVSTYKVNGTLRKNDAMKLLFTNHVKKYVRNASLSKFTADHKANEDANYLLTRLVISPLKQYPYITNVSFEGRYKGDTLVVQEFLHGVRYTENNIQDTLFSLLKFHPEKYKRAKAQ